MKSLLILRHAKTQPDAPAGDHARELTERGRRNAAAMGAYIHSLTGPPDAIITSDATRALQTAEIVAPAVGYTAPLTVEPRIYGADVETLLALVRSILDEVNCAMIVGHNPGFEDLAEALAGNHDGDVRLPTSGLAVLEFDVDRWDAARRGTGRLREVATPRTIA
ncbi:MAG: histidine phosphatase family protein [Chloroflexi bacterium]|nr:histidine phosphatase family protein [Chloroflexota bacterium]